jgi:hypothetical protein
VKQKSEKERRRLALFSRAAVAAVSSPPEIKEQLALFSIHFWIK